MSLESASQLTAIKDSTRLMIYPAPKLKCFDRVGFVLVVTNGETKHPNIVGEFNYCCPLTWAQEN